MKDKIKTFCKNFNIELSEEEAEYFSNLNKALKLQKDQLSPLLILIIITTLQNKNIKLPDEFLDEYIKKPLENSYNDPLNKISKNLETITSTIEENKRNSIFNKFSEIAIFIIMLFTGSIMYYVINERNELYSKYNLACVYNVEKQGWVCPVGNGEEYSVKIGEKIYNLYFNSPNK